MPLPTHDRYPFSMIDQRPAFDWPQGKRLAFYVCFNIEVFAFGEGMGSDVGLANPAPNHRSYAWRDYGNRVGLSRMLDLVDELGLPACHNVNSFAYDMHPQMFERIRRRGDEIIGHGRTNAERQAPMWEEDERRLIRETTEAIARHEGRPPRGWLGPWLAETRVTPDLLQEAGYTYLLDWACDDQPIWMRTRNGRILSIPYPIEVNDSPAIVFRQHSAEDFADMIVDQFDEMLRQSEAQALVCPIALHTFVIGQPFRMRHLRRALEHCAKHPGREQVWFTRPGEIAEYCYRLPEHALA
ncbi:polysaccharide deacetylase family protein [Pigmentiphaga soli]|uniref:Polysaccharide deacetylase family protein n=1 Tax=Pigmentiphaga soli TaxID=1007095 RepID=A0ABP8GCJ0_9BURK